jgi:hypothetical protein
MFWKLSYFVLVSLVLGLEEAKDLDLDHGTRTEGEISASFESRERKLRDRPTNKGSFRDVC